MTLAKLPGKDVDTDLLTRLPQATGKTRRVLIELAAYRQLEGALPAIGQSIEDSDAGIRAAAIQAIGVLGGIQQVTDLVTLAQKTRQPGDIEKALLAVSARSGQASVPKLQPLMQSKDPALRIVGMRAMAIVGGPDALAAVKSAIADKEEEVQDEAVRTLSTWPNKWTQDSAAGEVLLTLAKSGKKTSHQVLGLRGYLQYLRGDKSLAGADKMAKINDLLGLIQRPEEERLAIAVLSGVEAPGALEMLTKFAADPAVAEEACSAIVTLAGKNVQGVSADQRRSALQTVVEKSKDARTKRRAEELLKRI
jgi:HEAT repeat protein